MTKIQQLTARIARLSPSELAIIEKLVEKLERGPKKPTLTLDQAIDEFEHEHSELLRLLAK
jgi:hypothetical protein